MNLKLILSKKNRIALFAGVVLTIFVLVFLLMPHQRSLVLPQAILQLRLTEEVHGKQAQNNIDAMHKNMVTPSENVIGSYFSTDGSAKLYVSLYGSRSLAEQQCKSMLDLIRQGGGTFTYFREFQVQNEKVYLCLGLGQAHYFFLHETELYWWSVDVQIAQASMQELVRLVENTTLN